MEKDEKVIVTEEEENVTEEEENVTEEEQKEVNIKEKDESEEKEHEEIVDLNTEDDDEGFSIPELAGIAPPGVNPLHWLFQQLSLQGGLQPEEDDDEEVEPILPYASIECVAEDIRKGSISHIIVLCGAGLSTAAGIPDFRSPGTGLYDNMGKYNLPDPTSVFDIEYFNENPRPFFELSRELLHGGLSEYRPTLAHYFIRLLHEKNVLMRAFTQNIDGLEGMTGIPLDMVVHCHGHYHSAHCLNCGKEYTGDDVMAQAARGDIPTCRQCDGIVKPDVVFFGESLPSEFFTHSSSDFPECDLLIILGTSLTVAPVSNLVHRIRDDVPRLVLNRESVKMRFSSRRDEKRNRNVEELGDLQESSMKLATLLGWKHDLLELYEKNEGHGYHL